MAKVLDVINLDEDLRKRLLRSFQSGHINFLIGSGASLPAIPAAGNIEAEISELVLAGKDSEAYERMYAFLLTVQEPTNKLINGVDDESNKRTVSLYEDFLKSIEQILLARRTALLPRQATIFTTNYDLFLEKSSAACPSIIFNDGFGRTPSLGQRMEYSSRNFFRSTYNTGNLYEYKVEVPCINLVKLHGSLSWLKEKEDILLRVQETLPLAANSTSEQKRAFVDKYAVVLPQAAKFRETLMDRTYYDLLRIYANSLDRENTLMVAFGFSFGDEHIRDITMRALKNPTLRLMIYAFDNAAKEKFSELFEQYSNVEIVFATGEKTVDFQALNTSLNNVLRSK